MNHGPKATMLTAAVMLMAGCGGTGSLSVRSVTGEAERIGRFDLVVYNDADANTVDVVAVAGSADDPKQMVHLRMVWRPRAARTPMDTRATNATVTYVVFDGAEAGVYGGGGLMFPSGKPGGATFRARMEQASVRLTDASAGFQAPLELAVVDGAFVAERDAVRTMQLLRRVRLALRQRLGYPRFVGLFDLRPPVGDLRVAADD